MADRFALGSDGSVFVTRNQLHGHSALNEGVGESTKRYHIVKMKLER